MSMAIDGINNIVEQVSMDSTVDEIVDQLLILERALRLDVAIANGDFKAAADIQNESN